MWNPFNLFKKRKVRGSKVDKLMVRTGYGGAQWSDKDFKNFADESYLKNVISFRCIKEIAENVACVPWGLFTINSEGKKDKEIYDHPFIDIMRRPNPKEGWPFLMAKATAFLLMAGNSYVERISPETGPNKGVPKELYVQRPDRMRIEVNETTGWVDKYVYTVGGRETSWRVDPVTRQADLLHLLAFHPTNDWYGAAITQSVAREIDTSNEQTEWNKKLLENEGRPGLVITIVGNLDDEAYERMEKSLNEKFGGAGKAGKNLILEGEKGTKAEPYGWSPTDMDFLEGGRELARRISWGYGVPPQLIGIPGDATFCLPANTRIMTNKGSINIIDIKEGDKVWSINKENKLELKVVLKSGKTGKKSLIKLRTKNRTITLTGNHPILVRKDRKKNGLLDFKLEYIPASEIKCGDIIVVLENLPDIGSKTSEFTSEMMELFGYYIGDGNMCLPVYQNENRGYKRGGHLSLAITEDNPVGEYYSNLASRIWKANPIRCERSLRYCSNESIKWMIELGFKGTAKEKRIPKWINEKSKELKLSFLRGLVDSDGSINELGYITFAFANEELLKDVRDLCISCGLLVSNIRHTIREVLLPNKQNFQSEMWWLTLARVSDVAEIGTHDPRYQKRISDNLNRVGWEREHLYACGKRTKNMLRNLIPIDYCRYSRIMEITYLDEEDVYDIEIEGNHNFFAENVCVHNSNYQEARLAFYEDTIFYVLAYMLSEVNNWIFKKKDRLMCDMILDNVPALAPRRERMWKRAQEANFLTINEKRELVGKEPRPEGNIILVPNHMIPLDMAGEVNNGNTNDDEDDDKSSLSLKRLTLKRS